MKAQSTGSQTHLLLLFVPCKLQLEYTARLDFLWRVQAKEEINEMKELREHNENMLRNILPSHVARHFLEKDRDNEVSPSWPIGRNDQHGAYLLTLTASSGRMPLSLCENMRIKIVPVTRCQAPQPATVMLDMASLGLQCFSS